MKCVWGVRMALCALGVLAGSATAAAQTPDLFFVSGRNVNTLGPTPSGPNPALAGNPKHKQRNEDSCDVSPQNPWVVLCANNDYRGIELFGDSWIGLSIGGRGAEAFEPETRLCFFSGFLQQRAWTARR